MRGQRKVWPEKNIYQIPEGTWSSDRLSDIRYHTFSAPASLEQGCQKDNNMEKNPFDYEFLLFNSQIFLDSQLNWNRKTIIFMTGL